MHPDPAGVTHLSSETFLLAAYDPADAPKCHSTEKGEWGVGGEEEGSGAFPVLRNPISMATRKTPSKFDEILTNQ